MSTETKAVETKVETAATQPETVVTPTTTEVDYEVELQKKDAEIAKIKEDKENYRKGMLKAKGKLPEEDNLEDESLDDKVSRLVKEQILNTKEAQVQAEKDALVTTLAKKNKELTLALGHATTREVVPVIPINSLCRLYDEGAIRAVESTGQGQVVLDYERAFFPHCLPQRVIDNSLTTSAS